jgi:quinol monooxygenase YgiN
MSPPIVVVARIKAKPDQIQRVAQELRALLAPTRAEAGCRNFDMHQSTGDPSLFLFHETWDSEAHLERHFQTPHLQHWLGIMDDLLAEPLEVTRWRRVG